MRYVASLMLVLLFIPITGATQVTLVANSTYGSGWSSTIGAENTFANYVWDNKTFGTKTLLTAANLNSISKNDSNVLTQVGSASLDAIMVVNFTLSGVQSVNFMNISFIGAVTTTAEPLQIGLYNKTIPGWQRLSGRIPTVVSQNVLIFYNMTTAAQIQQFITLNSSDTNYNASWSFAEWVNGTANAGLSNDLYQVVINYNPYPAPSITGSQPTSPAIDTTGNIRNFNLTTDQTTNVFWYINGTAIQTNSTVTSASYNNQSAVAGVWNITAIANNTNGAVSKTWIWNVTAPPTDTSFTVDLPVGQTIATFTATNKSSKNVQPTGQNNSFGHLKITNTGNIIENFKMWQNTTSPTGVTLKYDLDNNPTGATNITDSIIQIITGLGIGSSQFVWLWTDYWQATPMNQNRVLNVNSSI